jgi:hypothetical protein
MPRGIYTSVDTAARAGKVESARFDYENLPVMGLLPASNHPRSGKYKRARPKPNSH